MSASVQEQARWVVESVGVYATSDSVVHVRGEDAHSWLSGQVTNDIRAVNAQKAAYVLAVSVKGRILTDAWVRAADSGLALILPERKREAALTSFDKHIIMEDVELSVDPGLRVLTVLGPKSLELLRQSELLVDAYETARIPAAPGYDLWLPEAELAATKARLTRAAHALGGGAVDDAGWAQACVSLGVPRCGVDFGDDTYPQEAGLKTRAVSFNKGCYLGQEVICMLENRGQLARRLVQLEAAGADAVPAGTMLQDADGKRVGEITSSAVTDGPKPATQALGYLKRSVWEVGHQVRSGERTWTVRAVVGLTNDECPIVAR